MSDKIQVPIGGATDCAELAVKRGLTKTQAAKLVNRTERDVKIAVEGWGSWK